ncbi:LOW QUALITY PROTEIN: uncharacterized protein LOC110030775 [Phalaenopsis equestris]|uniref:LOW QUALITY PROTEIN: uncharacterized protein LOC110030775 n=1 Tax=Phalaenopsis equestris TaxID=78828 RepID=UPI0009E34E1C|nr:LOW QUALITY PROTEIN: uncharacterized protein LOC110030775 [Phalaenopsis equestris]
MGALYLYRGNLHRVSDIPRRWPMPPRAISLPQFRQLLRKRNLAIAQFSSRNPNAKPDPRVSNENHEDMDKAECPQEVAVNLISSLEPSGSALNDCKGVVAITEDLLALERVDSMDDGDGKEELNCKLDSTHEIQERKSDLEQKLHVLNEKKHYLVQMLKQILNAEEEIKRRSIQSAPARSSVPLQAEASVDMSSAARNPPKVSVAVNFGGDVGGESDAAVNCNIQTRQWPPVLAASPSATSIGRTSHGSFQHNTVHVPRGSAPLPATSSSLMATSMVSRFVPTVQQAHSMNLPSVSVSAAHFAASSPSPAASGGISSTFRDSR